jgi:NADPH:quinone reductase-like Zn-dependent oxidoreductase
MWNSLQIVDYTAAVPAIDALTASASSSNGELFDAIIDCVGNDEIFYESIAYLKSDGRFLTIAGNPLSGLKNRFLPVALGGVPRSYTSIMGQMGGAAAQEVAAWFEKGLITSISADSIFEMDQAAQVTIHGIFEKVQDNTNDSRL